MKHPAVSASPLGICLTAVLIAGLLEAGFAYNERMPRPRFEFLYSQWVEAEGNNGELFTVFHDREGGGEFICARDSRNSEFKSPISCFPTGRSWK